MESSRRDLLNDMAEHRHRPMLKKKYATPPFFFTPKRSTPQNGFRFTVYCSTVTLNLKPRELV